MLQKDEQALRILAEQWFIAEVTVELVSSEGEDWYNKCALSLAKITEEQATSN